MRSSIARATCPSFTLVKISTIGAQGLRICDQRCSLREKQCAVMVSRASAARFAHAHLKLFVCGNANPRHSSASLHRCTMSQNNHTRSAFASSFFLSRSKRAKVRKPEPPSTTRVMPYPRHKVQTSLFELALLALRVVRAFLYTACLLKQSQATQLVQHNMKTSRRSRTWKVVEAPPQATTRLVCTIT